MKSFYLILRASTIVFVLFLSAAKIQAQPNIYFSDGPADATLECGVPIPAEWVPTVQNICGTFQLNYSETQVFGGCPGNYALERLWSAMNTCGNFAFFIQIVNFEDTTPPSAIYVPINPTYSCPNPDGSDLFDFPIFEDNCSTSLNYAYSWVLVNGDDPCLSIRVITYTATDQCGNVTFVNWNEIFQDETPPELMYAPGDATENCQFNTEVLPAELPTFDDDCGPHFIEYVSSVLTDNGCHSTVQWQAFASDNCGNVNTYNWIVTYLGTNSPTFETVPPTCENCPIGIVDDYPTFSYDNCNGNGQVILTYNWVPFSANETHLVWTITDACDNFATAYTAYTHPCDGHSVGIHVTDIYPYSFTGVYYSILDENGNTIVNEEIIFYDDYLEYYMCLPCGNYSVAINDTEDGIGNIDWNVTVDGTVVLTTDSQYGYIPFQTAPVCIVNGCTDPTACNYNPLATDDDGTCAPIVTAQMLMFDSGANGWGNWWYSIINSESDTIQTGTLPAGASGMDEFCLIPGCYEMLLYKPFGGGGNGNQATWTLQYDDGTEILSGGAPSSTDFGFSIAGNQNNDCAVNIGDLLLFMSSFGCNGSCGLPDMNFDNTVNTSDLLLFMSTFGDVYY